MTVFTFDFKTFTTIDVEAPDEETARAALRNFSYDTEVSWVEPGPGGEGEITVTLRQVTADDSADAEAELVHDDEEMADE